ncbi:hypothetical protein [Methylocystis sp.]|uniref:hypothetical protein n=1 Tax=Methylocystis sp. TaxID=1911079 RepID=UPI002735CE25|nr:hypothetical protein [Methylocystis sp.]MDP3553080.1 hypothetical protein [Methylocystis sp.]
MESPNWKLEDDLKTVTLTFPSSPPVALRLSTTDVDDLLRNLGLFRGAMKPEIADKFDLGQKVEAVPDPKWVTEPDILRGDSLLHIRDPRFGWLHYLLPKAEAEKLANYFLVQIALPTPGLGEGRPN